MAEDLGGRLRRLEDAEAIRNLIASYGPLADAGAADAVAALWHEDGVYAVGGMGEAHGHVAISALIRGETHVALMAAGCAHILTPPVIDLSGDVAMARNHSLVLRHEGGTWTAVRASANRWTLTRGPQGWRVARRDNALLDGVEGARLLLEG